MAQKYNEPNGEQPETFNKLGTVKEKWIFFGLGYLCGIVAGIIMIYLTYKT